MLRLDTKSTFLIRGPLEDRKRMRFGIEDVLVKWEERLIREEEIQVLERLREEVTM